MRGTMYGLGMGLLMACAGQPAAGQATDSSPAADWTAEQRAVWSTVEAYGAAATRRDLDAYLAYFHPAFAGWHNGNDTPDGRVARVHGLTWYFSHSTTEDYSLEPLAIQVTGDVAVAHYVIRQILRYGTDAPQPGLSYWTDVLVREDGRWLLFSDHGGGVLEAEAARTPALRVAAVKLYVPDVNEASAFYRDVLGLPEQPGAGRHPGGAVVLDGGDLPFILAPVTGEPEGMLPGGARPKLSFICHDLAATMQRLKARGVRFLVEPPEPYGRNAAGEPLGMATWFRDPFGHGFSLVEQQRDREAPFDGVRIYNTGFYVPDMDRARAFYETRLGFPGLTDTYLPRSLPMGAEDGSLAYMLHLPPAVGDAGGVRSHLRVVFASSDPLVDAVTLYARGVRVSRTGSGSPVTVVDPFGIVSELVDTDEVPRH